MWEIDRRLQEDQARPMVYHLRFATCWQRKVKGLRMIVNSVFNGWRFEDVWLDEKSVPRALYAACTIGPTCGNLPRIIALHQSPTRVGNDVATCVSKPPQSRLVGGVAGQHLIGQRQAPGYRHGLRRRDDPPVTYFASSLRQVQHRHLHSVKQAVGWDHGSHHRSRSDDHPRERPRCESHRKYRAQVASEDMHLAKNDRDQA